MSSQSINGYFIALPEKTVDSEEWRSLSPSARCVYTTMMLKYRRVGSEANGRVKWKQPEIAEKTGISLRTVITCLQELKENEWISIWEPGGRWLDGTTYDVNPLYADGREG